VLNKLIVLSLKHRFIVLCLALLVVVLGMKKATELPIDVLPDLTKPTVTILTEAPGYSPEEVETLITIPLEYRLMGVSGLSRLRAINDVSLSLIYVEFDWGTDIYKARQLVQERLTGVELPESMSPYMAPVTSLMGNFILLAVTSPDGVMAGRELRTLADWTISPHLRSIPGISEVLAMGGGVKQIQIQPIPDRMSSYEVSLDELKKASAESVSNTTGGFLSQQSREIMVRNLGMSVDLSEIGQTVIKLHKDRPVRISDVAEVQWGIEPMRGDAGAGDKLQLDGKQVPRGQSGVVLNITKSPGFDTMKLTTEVETAIAQLKQSLPSGVEIFPIYRQADFISLSIENLKNALLEGALMVTFILILFLMNFRVTLITLTAIPLSLGMSVLVFDLMNLSVNSMTLGGLAVAIGMVVDDAIVDVENVFRRLRENALLAKPKPVLQVIASASAEVRSSILYATILIILVFVPLMALHGLEGRLFTPIALATMISMAASFLVSLTVIPALSSYLLNPSEGRQHQEAKLAMMMKWLFEITWLRFSLSQPLMVALISFVLLIFSLWHYSNMASNFLPSFKEPSVLIATTLPPGTSLEQTNQLALRAQDLLLQIKEVKTVGFRVGRAEKGDHVVPVSTVEFDIDFFEFDLRPRNDVMAELRSTMKSIPGTFSVLSTPLADRIGHMLSGVSAKIAIKVFGHDLENIRRVGNEIVDLARQIPGLEEARGEQQALIPQLRIEVDRHKASVYHVTPGSLNEQLSSLIGGEDLAKVIEGQRVYDLVLRLSREHAKALHKLENLWVDTESGQKIPLSYVAKLRMANGPNNIMRENSLRRFVVSINPTTDNLNQLVEKLQAQVESDIELPTGVTLSFEGEYQAQAQAKQTIFWSSVIVVFIIAVLLYSYFKSLALVLLVFITMPLSVIGGVLFTSWTINNISIATLVGFIAVSGISARNNIMLLSHYLHLMRHEGEQFNRNMVIRGTTERLVPILSTALSAGLALIPLVLALDQPGKEILSPIAIVIVGGLISSTLIGLGLTPALFYSFCRKSAHHSIQNLSPSSE
jgi:CzcA family heavy metal efflux pump